MQYVACACVRLLFCGVEDSSPLKVLLHNLADSIKKQTQPNKETEQTRGGELGKERK